MGDVVAALGVEDDKILALFDHDRQIIKRDIGAGAGVVETAIGVFLDGNGASVLCHFSLSSKVSPDPNLIL